MIIAKPNARLAATLAILLACVALIGIACTSEPDPTPTQVAGSHLDPCPRTNCYSGAGTNFDARTRTDSGSRSR